MKHHTTKSRRHERQSVLEVRVMSPRIAWFGFLKFTGWMLKLACLTALLTAGGWGIWHGIQRAFYQNPDFRLQVITLNANPVIDELGVAAAAGINLNASPNLFQLDVKDIAGKLQSLPEIAAAQVERHLPGTLAVTVIPRIPTAWIACSTASQATSRNAGDMLVDRAGIAYPCPAHQVESSATLPIIILPPANKNPIAAGEKIQHPELQHCVRLLDAARDADPDALQRIESVQQVNAWSMRLVTRQGTTATFGLSDHARQIENLHAALGHAGEKGYLIDTINLIPKYNIPITLREEPTPPRAIPVSLDHQDADSETRLAHSHPTVPKRN